MKAKQVASEPRGIKAKVRNRLVKAVVRILKAPEIEAQIWESVHQSKKIHPVRDITTYLYGQATKEAAHYVSKHMSTDADYDAPADLFEAALARVAIKGLYLEFGVARGKSINFIARHVEQTVHGFDSFEGLPEDWIAGKGKGAFDKQGELPDVRDNVQLHTGWFDQSLPVFAASHAGPIAFMNIDCDLYSSTKAIFDVLGDRITAGTVIRFGEYFNYPGWEQHEYKAFQEFIAHRKLAYKYVGYSRRTYSVVVLIGEPTATFDFLTDKSGAKSRREPAT